MSRVPEHGEIVAAATRIAPRTIEVHLPAIGAPTGRPLESDDIRQVTWTINHPDDNEIHHVIDRRRRRLLRLLIEADEQDSIPSIEHLASALEVSEATVRRDLAALQDDGHRVQTRGQRRRVS